MESEKGGYDPVEFARIYQEYKAGLLVRKDLRDRILDVTKRVTSSAGEAEGDLVFDCFLGALINDIKAS